MSFLFRGIVRAVSIAVPPAKLTSKGERTRARLLACARSAAIENEGHVEIAAVAERAGVVPSVIYRYFGSKAGMVSALVDDFFARLHHEVLDLDLEGEGDWATHEYLRLQLGVAFHYADELAPVLYTQLGREPEVMRTQAERVAAVIERAALSIRRAQRRGELPRGVDPELAGAAMFGAMQRVMVAACARPRRPPERKLVELLWRQVAAAVGVDPRAPDSETGKEHGT
jgi:AcrR family transcriptional regulator